MPDGRPASTPGADATRLARPGAPAPCTSRVVSVNQARSSYFFKRTPRPATAPGRRACTPSKEPPAMRSLLAGFLSLAVLAGLAPGRARGDEIPKEYRETVKKGLSWLEKQQHR